MKYYVCEGKPDGEYNAATKARKDAEMIFNQCGLNSLYIPTKYGVQKNKLLKFLQLFSYYKNYKIWNKKISELHENDVLVIQYPLVNAILNLKKVIEKCNKKKIITVILIHDLDSLRSKNKPRIELEDREVLKRCSYVIAHNEMMKKALVDRGCDTDKIISLEIFDYLTETEITDKKRVKSDPIIIAGNLSKEKAKYLTELKDVPNVKFNLYGKGYVKEQEEDNVDYKGAFLPEELLNKLDGSFGLIWDGESKEKCTGLFGEYLKYNNPHKTSLYLTSKLPVIVWKESAMAEFVLKNNVGITVDSLDDIMSKIEYISEEEYYEMINNTKEISRRLKKGEYLKKAIEKIFSFINEM